MSGETPITVVGNLTADPELRFTASGRAVANFTLASTPRTFDRQTNEWKDAETLFVKCSVWKNQAENVAESLTRGTLAIATGRLVSRSWEDRETGQKRTVMEIQAEYVGPALVAATATVTKTGRSGAQANAGGGWGPRPGSDDPWAQNAQTAPTPPPAPQGGGFDEPPF